MAVVISNSLVLPFEQTPGGTTPGSEIDATLKKTHIGYETIGTEDNMGASTEAAGFPVENLSNPLTTHRWKPTALPATVTISVAEAANLQYMGVASHTLATRECLLEFQFSTNGGSSWETIRDISPENNQAIMAIFSELAQDWRIRITRSEGSLETEMPSIGVFYAGVALVMQRGLYGGHTPVTMGRKTTRITNQTEGGQYAGNSLIREGVDTEFSWQNLTASWYRLNFEPFVVIARSQPFFIAWRPGEFPNEVGFVWTQGDIVPSNQGVRDLMQVSMAVSGYSDE